MSDSGYAHRDIEHTPETLEALGAISIVWGEIGAAIEALIWTLAGLFHDDSLMIERQILTNQISFHGRVRVIKQLLKRRRVKLQGFNARVREFLDEVIQLSKARNALIHSPEWYTDHSVSPAITYVRASRLGGTEGFYGEPERMTKRQFKELVNRMADCRDNGFSLVSDAQIHFEP